MVTGDGEAGVGPSVGDVVGTEGVGPDGGGGVVPGGGAAEEEPGVGGTGIVPGVGEVGGAMGDSVGGVRVGNVVEVAVGEATGKATGVPKGDAMSAMGINIDMDPSQVGSRVGRGVSTGGAVGFGG